MEPITLVIIGNKSSVRRLFEANGWFETDHLGPISLLKTISASLLNSSYHKGLMSYSYINHKRFQLGFERPTRSDTFRRRHHSRIWKTNLKFHGSSVWAGMASYDRSIGISTDGWPTHHISPSLADEDHFIARSLGIFEPTYIKLSKPEKGIINIGDPYTWDGKALLVDLSDET